MQNKNLSDLIFTVKDFVVSDECEAAQNLIEYSFKELISAESWAEKSVQTKKNNFDAYRSLTILLEEFQKCENDLNAARYGRVEVCTIDKDAEKATSKEFVTIQIPTTDQSFIESLRNDLIDLLQVKEKRAGHDIGFFALELLKSLKVPATKKEYSNG